MFVGTHKPNQRGDTIVEVLIAIAVASGILAIALSTMNRNLIATRTNQERIQASRLAQGQLELLKAAKAVGASLPAAGTAYCMLDSGTTANVTGGSPHTNPALDLPGHYSSCTSDGLYWHSIKESASEPGLYTLYVRWDALSGNGKNQVQMVYKL